HPAPRSFPTRRSSDLRDARAVERSNTITTQVEFLRAGLRTADIEFQADTSRALEPRLALLAAAAAGDPQAVESAHRVDTAMRAFLAARASEAAAWSKFSFLTVGGRMDL